MTTTTEASAVSWGAVIAGAVGAAALSLVLFLLGTGLGLAAVSPWGSEGISGTTAGISTIVWVTVVQLLASVLGGYLAGRLRTRWVTVHTDEVFFRDTAHGFLAWAVATLLMATLLSSAIAAAVSTGVKSAPLGYFVDTLLRQSPDNTAPTDAPVAVAGRGQDAWTRCRTPPVSSRSCPASVGQCVKALRPSLNKSSGLRR